MARVRLKVERFQSFCKEIVNFYPFRYGTIGAFKTQSRKNIWPFYESRIISKILLCSREIRDDHVLHENKKKFDESVFSLLLTFLYSCFSSEFGSSIEWSCKSPTGLSDLSSPCKDIDIVVLIPHCAGYRLLSLIPSEWNILSLVF